MTQQRLSTLLFDEPGPHNTEATLEVALRRARDLDLQHVVVATDTGKTARAVREAFAPPFTVVAVSNPAGVAIPVTALHDYLPRFAEHRRALRARGITSVAASLDEAQAAALARFGVVVTRIDWQRLAAHTGSGLQDLDRIGVATRVALTVAIWASLVRAIPTGVEVVAIAGTGFGGGGADTSLIVRTAERYYDLRVLEILARPRVGPPSEP